jgi:hypothetical protein
MLARLATFKSAPAQMDDAKVVLLRDTVKAAPGFIAGFHLQDPQTGTAYSLIVLEDTEAIGAVRDALAARPAGKRVGAEPDTVQFLTAQAF